MFLIVKRNTHYINHLLNHICYIAVRYGGSTFQSRLKKLFLLHKKALRIIYTLNYYDHTYKAMIILYKANNHSLNGRVQAFFKPTEAIHKYGTRQSKLFYVKKNKHLPQTNKFISESIKPGFKSKHPFLLKKMVTC